VGLEGGCSRPRGRGPEAGTLALDLFEKEEEIIIQLLVNSLLQPWNRMPEEETEGTRHAPRLVKAVPLFRRLSAEGGKERKFGFHRVTSRPNFRSSFRYHSRGLVAQRNGCEKRRRALVTSRAQRHLQKAKLGLELYSFDDRRHDHLEVWTELGSLFL
jgi:hypothetical protein